MGRDIILGLVSRTEPLSPNISPNTRRLHETTSQMFLHVPKQKMELILGEKRILPLLKGEVLVPQSLEPVRLIKYSASLTIPMSRADKILLYIRDLSAPPFWDGWSLTKSDFDPALSICNPSPGPFSDLKLALPVFPRDPISPSR